MMNQLVTVNNGSALIDFNREKIELIKRTIAAGTTDDQFALFMHQARRTGLDPLARQITCVLRWNNKTNRKDMSIQTAIDGYRLIADRTGKFAGDDDPIYDEGLTQYAHITSGRGNPVTATVTVYKIVSGIRVPFTATAAWAAYYPGDGPQSFMWRKMPHLMLGKCAEALALRKAFPAELSGVYVREEMQQAGFVEAEQEPEPNGNSQIVEAEVVEDDPQPEPVTVEADDRLLSKVADLRATIEGAGKAVQLGFVNQRLTDTGLYNATPHAFNAVKLWPGWGDSKVHSPETINGGTEIPVKQALSLFDWAVGRKLQAEQPQGVE